MSTYEKFCKRRSLNLDGNHRCSLLCPNCPRQTDYTNHGLKVAGTDISEEDFDKCIKFFGHINFEGQYSDPVHHPKFLDMLKKCYDNKVFATIQHASAAKPFNWYMKAFNINPNSKWRFSIDGLPKDSHKYRINQDGKKLFRIMKKCASIMKNKPSWQYIVFNYNEDHIEEAKQMAKDNNLQFVLMKSSRWLKGFTDHLMPSKKYRLDSTYD